MVKELLNTNVESISISVSTAILTILTSFFIGLIISITYMKTHRKGTSSQSFALTLIMVPAIIAIIIVLVGSNLARAFSLSAFAIIRFRSAAGDPKDISYVLFSLAAGLACGVGLFGYSILFTVLLCVFMLILHYMNFGVKKVSSKLLKITIPEDLDYEGVFDDVFMQYTTDYELKRVKTTDLGTLYELIYTVSMKNDISQKEFIDALRCRNGNLNIILSMNADVAEY